MKTFLTMPPETSSMDSSKVRQHFMKNVTYFSTENGIFVNMSIWEGPIATWKAEEITFDKR